MADERWLPVPGYEGLYEVSDLGRIRSACRRRGSSGTALKARLDTTGYPCVGLHRPGERRIFRIHRVVALAFIGPRPAGKEVRHLDGNKFNNTPANLAYGTRSENILDQVRHGTHNSVRRRLAAAGAQ